MVRDISVPLLNLCYELLHLWKIQVCRLENVSFRQKKREQDCHLVAICVLAQAKYVEFGRVAFKKLLSCSVVQFKIL